MRLITSIFCIVSAASTAASFGPITPSTLDLPPPEIHTQAEKEFLQPLEDLIAITEKNLSEQRQLLSLVRNYQKIKIGYLQNQTSKEAILAMVKSAHQLQSAIETHHFSQLFKPNFLEEIHFFSRIAAKKGLPRP